jgi:DUF1009 family protein
MAGRRAVERTLGLMCGAGSLPRRMAEEARGRGWRVVAFIFDGAPDLAGVVARVVPSRLTEMAPVLATCQAEGIGAVVCSGRFSMPDFLHTRLADADGVVRERLRDAGSRLAPRVFDAVIRMFAGIQVEVLDQRPFLGDVLPPAGCWTARQPTDAERQDARRGLRLARDLATASVGQALVLRDGVVTAVEAVEGTTAAILRGTALAGPGAIVVKAVAPDHDYRFDLPAIGLETIEAAAAGGAAMVAVEAGRVAILDPATVVRAADGAGLSVVSVDVTG